MKNKFLKLISIALCACALIALTACDSEKDGEDDKDGKGSSYSAIYGDVEIALGADATKVLDRLGEPKSKNEIGDCGGLGSQVRYDFSSFILYVLEADGTDTVDQITFKDDLVETSKGITVGSSVSDLKDAYGEPSETRGSSLIYRDGNKQLTVKTDSDKVTSIDMMCVTEE